MLMHDLATSISGTWYNELASQLDLEADGVGRLSGSLRSGVGEGPGRYPLTGFYDPLPNGDGAVIGFVVSWPNVHSLTVWAGHFNPDENAITTTWLLAGATDEWRSTNVGHDRFSHTPFGAAEQKTKAGSSVPHVPSRPRA